MNLAYLYLLNKHRQPYCKGERYVLLRNIDEDTIYSYFTQIAPGEYFVMKESDVHSMFKHIAYNKKIVLIKRIQSEDG